MNVTDLTGGIFNGQSLAEGNNLGCFALQLAAQAEPDLLVGEFKQLLTTLGDVVSQLSCPQLEAIDEDLLKQFPGYMKDRTYDTGDILNETLGGLLG